MALALVRCSIEADQGGTPHARARVSLVSWEGRGHALLFMVPLGLPSARPMAQALRLPFEYYILLTLCTRKPKIRLLHDASAARKPKIRLRGLPIINN